MRDTSAGHRAIEPYEPDAKRILARDIAVAWALGAACLLGLISGGSGQAAPVVLAGGPSLLRIEPPPAPDLTELAGLSEQVTRGRSPPSGRDGRNPPSVGSSTRA